jgi:hypothetical protein
MSKTGLFLSVLLALAFPVYWIVGAARTERSNPMRIPVHVKNDEPIRHVKVRIFNR